MTNYKDGVGNYKNQGGLDISSRVTKSADQSINNTTWTAISWNQEDYDTDNMHDNSTNNSRLTATTAGKYMFGLSILWASNNTGGRMVAIYKNGSEILRYRNSAVSATEFFTSGIVEMVATDYAEIFVHQDSGSALNVLSLFGYFGAHKL